MRLIVLLICTSSWLSAQVGVAQLMLNKNLTRQVELREFVVEDSSIINLLDSAFSFKDRASLDSTKMEMLVVSDNSAWDQVRAEHDQANEFIEIVTQFRVDNLVFSNGVIGYVVYGRDTIFLNNLNCAQHSFSPTGKMERFNFLSLEKLKLEVDSSTLMKLTAILARVEYENIGGEYKWVGSLGN